MQDNANLKLNSDIAKEKKYVFEVKNICSI